VRAVYFPTARDHENGSLRYAYAESSVGWLLIVIGETGVADVILGDSPRQMLSCALKRFPGMGLFPDLGAHAEWVAAVIARIEFGVLAAQARAGLDAPRYREAS